MIFLLVVFIGLLLLSKYKLGSRFIFAPVTIVLAVFFVSTFVCAANFKYWGDISTTTFFVIITALLAFSIGHTLSERITVSRKDNEYNYLLSDIAGWKTVIAIVFMIVVTYFDFRDVLAVSGGASTSLLQVVASARRNLYIENAAIEHGALLQQGIYICRVLAYLYIFDLLYTRKYKEGKIKLLSLIPIAIYTIQAILSTGRTEFIYILYAFLVMNYCLSMSRNSWTRKRDFKYTKQIFWAVVAFLVLFLVLANVRSSGEFHPFRTLSVYMGSSISALSQYIERNGIWKVSSYFGEETMSLLYTLLRPLGLSNHSTVVVLGLVYVDTSITNIYTTLRRYLHDFGYLGMLGIMFLLGTGYSYAFKNIRRNNEHGLKLIIYSFLSYPLVEMSIEERFFSNLITARTVYCLIYFVVLYKLLFKKIIVETIT